MSILRAALGLLRELAVARPMKFSATMALLVLSGLAEGVGLLTLLPLLSIATSDEPQSGRFFSLLEAVNVPPELGVLLAIIVIGLTVKAFLLWAGLRNIGDLSADLSADLRLRLIRNLVRARWEFLVTQPAGAIANAIGTQASRAYEFVWMSCLLVVVGVQILIYLALALSVSWRLTIGAALFGAFLFVLLNSVVKASQRSGEVETQTFATMMTRLTDGIGAIKVHKAMAREGSFVAALEKDVDDLSAVQRRQSASRALISTAQEPLMGIALGIAAWVTLSNGFQIERLIFMALVFQRVVGRIGNAQNYYHSLGQLQSAYQSLLDKARQADSERETHSGTERVDLNESVSMDAVTFSFPDRPPVLNGLDLQIPARSLTAIMGPSGIGKSTIIDLLMGLITPQSGQIRVDGIPLGRLDMSAWRSQLGYVPQDIALLHDSIERNVTLGETDLSEADIRRALESAGALKFVDALPKGIRTVVGERGAALSGGQRQRLGIARALVRSPRLLILDEPTSALDEVAERAILETLTTVARQTTVLVVSHQIAVHEIADHVFVMSPPGTSAAAS